MDIQLLKSQIEDKMKEDCWLVGETIEILTHIQFVNRKVDIFDKKQQSAIEKECRSFIEAGFSAGRISRIAADNSTRVKSSMFSIFNPLTGGLPGSILLNVIKSNLPEDFLKTPVSSASVVEYAKSEGKWFDANIFIDQQLMIRATELIESAYSPKIAVENERSSRASGQKPHTKKTMILAAYHTLLTKDYPNIKRASLTNNIYNMIYDEIKRQFPDFKDDNIKRRISDAVTIIKNAADQPTNTADFTNTSNEA